MMSNQRVSVTTQNNLRGLVTTQNIRKILRKEYVNKTVCYTDRSESEIINEVDTIKMDVNEVDASIVDVDEVDTSIIEDNKVNTLKVKNTRDEEPSVMENSDIKALGYFKLFECGKTFFKNMHATYGCACMENTKENHWEKNV